MNTGRSTRRTGCQGSRGSTDSTRSRGRRSRGRRRMAGRRGRDRDRARARAGLVFHRSDHPELSASRKSSTAVASAGEAAAVPSPYGGPCGSASRREHQEGGEEQYSQPTVPMSCGAGHRPSARMCSCLPLPRSMGRAGESDSHWRPQCGPGRWARNKGKVGRCAHEGWRSPSSTARQEPSPTARCPRCRRKPSWR